MSKAKVMDKLIDMSTMSRRLMVNQIIDLGTVKTTQI